MRNTEESEEAHIYLGIKESSSMAIMKILHFQFYMDNHTS